MGFSIVNKKCSPANVSETVRSRAKMGPQLTQGVVDHGGPQIKSYKFGCARVTFNVQGFFFAWLHAHLIVYKRLPD